ncbi:MAG: sigma-70 family RNA polymerase sigma factor, partial [Chitinophaga rupis]
PESKRLSAEEVYMDRALLERLSKGDSSAYETIYRRYVYSLYVAAFRRLNDRQRSEDLVQDVFFRVWNKREEMAQVENLAAYLHTAVRYEVLKLVTRRKGPLYFFEPFESMMMGSEAPDSRLMAKELFDLVYKYADTLPKKRKQIFLLHVTNRLSTREIADTLEISQKTVQNQLGTALNGFRRHVSPVIMMILSSWL